MLPTPSKIDLHTHTNASDGTDSPSALLHKAHRLGLVAVAVTDHDTVKGLEEAELVGQALGVQVVRGCEISTRTEFGSSHILGLWLPKETQHLEDFFADLARRRHIRNELVINKLCALGLNVTKEEIERKSGLGNIGRPHIASVLCDKGYVQNLREAFDLYLGIHGQAYVPKQSLTPEEAISLLHANDATVVWAHPLLHHDSEEQFKILLTRLVDAGLDAIEAWHSEHTEAEIKLCLEAAQYFDLGVSAGSDYHGLNKPGIELGQGYGNLHLPLTILEDLMQRRRKKGLPC